LNLSLVLVCAACTSLLSVAVWQDLKTGRISNQLILVGLVIVQLLSVLPNGLGWFSSVQGIVVGLLIFIPFYLLRILGAGDVKLLSVVGGFFGYPGILLIGLYTSIAGGVLALAVAFFYGQLFQILSKLRRSLVRYFLHFLSNGRPGQFELIVGSKQIPYAVAISVGTLIYVVLNKLQLN